MFGRHRVRCFRAPARRNRARLGLYQNCQGERCCDQAESPHCLTSLSRFITLMRREQNQSCSVSPKRTSVVQNDTLGRRGRRCRGWKRSRRWFAGFFAKLVRPFPYIVDLYFKLLRLARISFILQRSIKTCKFRSVGITLACRKVIRTYWGDPAIFTSGIGIVLVDLFVDIDTLFNVVVGARIPVADLTLTVIAASHACRGCRFGRLLRALARGPGYRCRNRCRRRVSC